MTDHNRPPSVRLLGAAQGYAARDWCIIPIRHQPGTDGKQPACRWKPFQERRPTEAELRRWFRDGRKLDGLAVICGEVSGGLVCRDFDDASSYERWAGAHPELAKTLPTVKTDRGHHVYFRSSHRGISKLGDGELRGGGYCLLPPSVHPSGHVYGWLVMLSDATLPEVDPSTCGLAVGVTEKQRHRDTEKRRNRSNDCPALSVTEAIEQAFRATLPTGEGQRNGSVFNLARRLKAVPSLADAPAAELREIVQDWHRRALPVIGTKPFDATWAEFVYAWPRVRFPAGQDPLTEILARADEADLPPCARAYDSSETHRLIKLCRELQRSTGDAPFFLSCRTAGRLLDMDHQTAWRRLNMLAEDKLLEVVTPGTTHRATRYRFREDEAESV